MDTDSFYLALILATLEVCIQPEVENAWNETRMKYCNKDYFAYPCSNSFTQTCCQGHMKNDKRESEVLKFR